MLLRQLEYLNALAREGHFGRAAEACHVSQPALSAGIRKLETELRVQIVQRGQRFEGFTPEGTQLLPRGDGRHITTSAERRVINRVRPVMAPKTRKTRMADPRARSATAMGYPMFVRQPGPDHGRDRRGHTDIRRCVVAKLDRLGSIQWPCTDEAPRARRSCTSTNSSGARADSSSQRLSRHRALYPQVPADPHHRQDPEPVQRGCADPSHPECPWHKEDILEIHPHDAEVRGIRDGDEVTLTSRVGETTLHAMSRIGCRWASSYTTFHYPESGANVVTTDNSDWATNCPEYKVTAVQVSCGRRRCTTRQTRPVRRPGPLR